MRSLRYLFAILFLFAGAAYAKGPDYTGVWQGSIATTINGKPVKLPFKIEVQAKAENLFSGLTELTVTVNNVEYRNECHLMGSLQDGNLRFTDAGQRTNNVLPEAADYYWCVKSGLLHMETRADGTRVLKGDITGNSEKGGSCLSGPAELVSQKPNH